MEPLQEVIIWVSLACIILLVAAQRYINGKKLSFEQWLVSILVGSLAGRGFMNASLGIWPLEPQLDLSWFVGELFPLISAALVVLNVALAALVLVGAFKRP